LEKAETHSGRVLDPAEHFPVPDRVRVLPFQGFTVVSDEIDSRKDKEETSVFGALYDAAYAAGQIVVIRVENGDALPARQFDSLVDGRVSSMIGLDVKSRIAIREDADLLFDYGQAVVCRPVVDDD
jgi:hypothetical protein